MTRPRFGLAAYGLPLDELLVLAQAAEQAGFDLLWLGEHLVVPTQPSSTHPTSTGTAASPLNAPVLDPGTELHDPWVALSAVAATTTVLRVATGILVLPLHQPLVVARAAASLQQLSRGRFVLGVGTGWVKEEFDAVGVGFEQRGQRMDEQLQVLQRLWAGGPTTHEGAHVAFRGVQVTPSPVQVPVVVGGHSPPALRRAALADGWLSSGVADLSEAAACRSELRRLRERAGVADEPFAFHGRLGRWDPDLVEQAVDDGWEDLVLWADQAWPPGVPLEDKVSELTSRAAGLGVRRRELEVAR